MIVPMKKASLVILDKARDESLEQLREIGVVHLDRKPVSSDALAKLLDRKSKTEIALGILSGYKLDKNKIAGVPPVSGVAAQVMDFSEQRKNLQDQALSKEISRIEKWGDFDPRAFQDLANAGIALTPYELPPAAYTALQADETVCLIVLGRDKGAVYVVSVGTELAGQQPFTLPEASLTALRSKAADVERQLTGIEANLAELAYQKAAVKTEIDELTRQIEYETAKAGLEGVDTGEVALSWISGFVPEPETAKLKAAAAENGWALLLEEPNKDKDTVPTLLKENKFVNFLRPITDFLDITPGYWEPDISLWFLIFFSIFFGMIWGDAGYGAVLLLIALIATIKTAKNGVHPMARLLWLLGGCNFLWGVAVCAWFGMDLQYIPDFLKNLSLPAISGANPDGDTVRHNLMIICFTLALIQLNIGHIIAIMRSRGPTIMGHIGSMCMLIGMYRVVIFLVVDPNRLAFYPLNIAVGILVVGFVLDYMFSNYETSLGQAIADSTKGIINKILGIANIFSDIMSYIRLWAVGLAGSAIAMVVDTMAGGMLGSAPLFVFGIILLVFGHGLNLALNVLSVLVHGVRLNTLEFSTHTGLSWAGFRYKPFAKD